MPTDRYTNIDTSSCKWKVAIEVPLATIGMDDMAHRRRVFSRASGLLDVALLGFREVTLEARAGLCGVPISGCCEGDWHAWASRGRW